MGGLRFKSSEIEVCSLTFEAEFPGSRFKVQGSRFKVQGSRFKVSGFRSYMWGFAISQGRGPRASGLRFKGFRV